MPQPTQGPNSYDNPETAYGGADAVPASPDVPLRSEEPPSMGRYDEEIHVRGRGRTYVLGIIGLVGLLVLAAWLVLAVLY